MFSLRQLIGHMKEAIARKMRTELKAEHFGELDELEKTYQECGVEELHAYEDESDRARKAGL
jgi:hypothetical protein